MNLKLEHYWKQKTVQENSLKATRKAIRKQLEKQQLELLEETIYNNWRRCKRILILRCEHLQKLETIS